MKIFIATVKKDGYTADYTVKAETKEEAIEKIRKISGERVSVKEK